MTTALPLLQADWPTPPGVHALTTRRHGAGVSPEPFAQFNLGNRHAADGDSPANV
ncbi:multi-copper polyphenol oxidoreductase, partial [Acinetobacter baumannii]